MDVAERLRGLLDAEGLEHERTGNTFVVVLPGRAKLRTTVSLELGEHALTVNAFVCRRPDENAGAVHRWLLQQNTRLFAVSFALDRLGDIYLVGHLPVRGLAEDDLDRLLGAVLQATDESFNTILRLGFASAIEREHAWRRSRGESTDNLTGLVDDVG